MTQPKYDPEKWPLAPGNAPADIEAALQASVASAPEPTAEMRERVAQIFRRSRTARKDSA